MRASFWKTCFCNHSKQAIEQLHRPRQAINFSPRHRLATTFEDGLVFIEWFEGNARAFTKSSAVLHILDALGGIWRVLSWVRLIPVPVRDKIYACVARPRLRWFGKHDVCSLALASRIRVLP